MLEGQCEAHSRGQCGARADCDGHQALCVAAHRKVSGASPRYQKLYERTAKEVAAKDSGFMKEKGGRLKLTGADQYGALPCVFNTANAT